MALDFSVLVIFPGLDSETESGAGRLEIVRANGFHLPIIGGTRSVVPLGKSEAGLLLSFDHSPLGIVFREIDFIRQTYVGVRL